MSADAIGIPAARGLRAVAGIPADSCPAEARKMTAEKEPAWQRRGICHLCRCAATPCPERWGDDPQDIAHSGVRAALAELAPLCVCRDGRPVRRRTVRPYRARDHGRGTLAR